MKIYIKRYKKFLPVEYVDGYNKGIKKKINIYILFLLLFNLLFYAEIKKENNRIEKYLSEIKIVNKENSLGNELINRVEDLKWLIEDHKILNFILERNDFEIEVHNDYKDLVIKHIKNINGKIKEINLNETNGIASLKGELK